MDLVSSSNVYAKTILDTSLLYTSFTWRESGHLTPSAICKLGVFCICGANGRKAHDQKPVILMRPTL